MGAQMLVLNAGSAWQFQDWRYGKQLAELGSASGRPDCHQQRGRLGARRSGQTPGARTAAVYQRAVHCRELSDAQTKQARLLNHLVTSDLRLSVLLDAADPASGCSVPAGTATAAWYIEERAPDLTQRMLNELSTSPTQASQGHIALAAC